MKTLKELLAEAKSLTGAAQTRELTAEERSRVAELPAEIAQAKSHETSLEGLRSALDSGAVAGATRSQTGDAAQSKSIGEFFRKSVEGTRYADQARAGRLSLPEFRAATDVVSGVGLSAPQAIAGVVTPNQYPLTIASLFASGQLTSDTLSYMVQEAVEGAATPVAPGGLKPSLAFKFRKETEVATKVAGIVRIQDEMLEDLDYLVSVIETQLVFEVMRAEEKLILSGDGASATTKGLLNRDGVLVHKSTGSLSRGVFEAVTRTQLASGRDADAVVMHPLDYEKARLATDGNGQYVAGGPFVGQYGNGGVLPAPALWGLRTVVTPAIAEGTALVGAFQSATLFRKGGITLEATNSHESDFAYNVTTLRAEERIALLVQHPAAFAKVTATA